MIEIIIPVVLALVAVGLVLFFVIKQKVKQKNYNKQFDYTTKHGIRVKLSPRLKDLPASDIEAWTDDVVEFWFAAKGWAKNKSYDAIKPITIFMYDQEYLERAGMKVSGIAWPETKQIELATLYKAALDQNVFTPYKKVKSLFRHEVSHVITNCVGGIPYDDDVHHALFKEVELGA